MLSEEKIKHEDTQLITETQTWKCIDTFFRDNQYALIQHHIDSYNDFYDTGIFKIFQENNKIELRIQNSSDEDDKYTYRCILYLGGISGKSIYFGKPILQSGNTDAHLLFPNEARIRNLTYSMSIHYDVDIEFLENGKRTGEISTHKKVFLGKFPIMVQSKYCVLQGLPRDMRYSMGECRNDLGGYFIIDGKEKTIIPLELNSNNTIYVSGKDPKGEYSAQIKFCSISENTSKPVRNLFIQLKAPKVSEKLATINENGNIVVEIPNVRKVIPLMIVFRALGVISDKDIISMCILDLKRYADLIPLFKPSMYDAGQITTQELALKYINQFCKYNKTRGFDYVLSILSDNLFPHIGELNFIEKAYYLGYLVFRLLLVQLGVEAPTDRDNLKNKRIELVGTLHYNLFRDYYKIQLKQLQVGFEKRLGIFTNEKRYDSIPDIQKVVRENWIDIFQQREIYDGFKKAFKGNWGAHKHTKRVGIVQDLTRLSFNSMIAHLRKITLDIDATLRIAEPRKLHSSHWGFFDFLDTPDGGNIGVHKTMTIMCIISSGFSRSAIIDWLIINASLKKVSDFTPIQLSNTIKVFINGFWAGNVASTLETVAKFKLHRRLGYIPALCSISFNYRLCEIEIFTDAGRMCRPIYYRDETTKKFWFETDRIVAHFFGSGSGSISWNDYIGHSDGYLDNAVTVVPPKSPANSLKGIVDYIDPNETENALIAIMPKQLSPQNTHLEIHQSLTFGLMANLIPFPQNNPVIRNCFSCSQSKQAVSIYSTQFQNRMDKSAILLNYGQSPLIKTRFLEIVNHSENPYGVNAIVAVSCFTGYNVEDAILINEGAIKRGLFQTTYFTTYEMHEEKSGISGAKSNKFIDANVIGSQRGVDYTKLDNFGIIPEGTHVHDKMALIGMSMTDPTNPQMQPKDISVLPKKGQLGTVNKTFITESEIGQRIAKVRISELRTPNLGDKFASRCGLKGTVGLIIPECDMPFTAEGIRPDMIINPHTFPTRMTIAQFIECIIGKACCVLGGHGNGTAFETAKFQDFGEILVEQGGFHSSGKEILYNGQSGEQMETEIFIGPTYYMRLKHMVKDKINYRERGPNTNLTRQPTGGRSNGGGLRLGEMERDMLVSHGINNFRQEAHMHKSDAYKIAVCNTTGMQYVLNSAKNIYLSPSADGPLQFNSDIVNWSSGNSSPPTTLTKHGQDFSIVNVPYAFKLFMQELQALNMGMHIITDKNISNLESLSYGNPVTTKESVPSYKTSKRRTSHSIIRGGDSEDVDEDAREIQEEEDNQVLLNTLMNQADSIENLPEKLYTPPDYDNMDKYYEDTDEENEEDNRPLLEILEEDDTGNNNSNEELDMSDFIDEIYEDTPIVQPPLQNITVNPIINIGNGKNPEYEKSSAIKNISGDSSVLTPDNVIVNKED